MANKYISPDSESHTIHDLQDLHDLLTTIDNSNSDLHLFRLRSPMQVNIIHYPVANNEPQSAIITITHSQKD